MIALGARLGHGMGWVITIAVALAAFVGGVLFGMSRRRGDGEKLVSAIVDASPLALLVYADAGAIVFANAEAERLFAEGRALRGSNFLHLLNAAPESLREALLGDEQLFTLDVDGHDETFMLSRASVQWSGAPHTLLMVNLLTREVSRREVEVLKKVLRVISHELNNSLASVSSLLSSARFIAENPEHVGRLEEVLSAVEERTTHLQTFLSRYSDLARLPRPRKRLVPWGSLLRSLQHLFPEVRFPDGVLGEAFIDETQVEQLVINLLKNAEEAGGDVEVRIERTADGGWRLRVLDRGTGFSEEALRNALLPFYTTKPNGSGMGLALCREIAEGHGGALGIRSRVDGGTAVSCTFPPEDAEMSGKSQLTLTSC